MSESIGALSVPDNKRDRGTKTMFGRPHHWMQDDVGKLHLFPGVAPGEGRAFASIALAEILDGKTTVADALDSVGVPKA